jgi:hypothetical protein
MALQPFGPWSLFNFLNPIHSRYDSLDGGSARRKVATYTQNINIEFEPAIPVFDRAKTVPALDSAATVIGALHCTSL